MSSQIKITLPDGGHLNTKVDGLDDAPWIVLSNSVLTDLSVWDQQVEVLDQQFRVLRYDQRGHGASSLPMKKMSFVDYGADIIALLDAFGIQSCVFVGLSMGVPSGLAAFAANPERFDAFVAVDGVAKSAAGREAFWAERRETARTQGMTEIANSTTPRWLPGADLTSSTAAALNTMIANTPVEGFATATEALASYDQSAALAGMSVPFMGIIGTEDGAMPQALRNQFGNLSDVRFVDIPDAGHIPNLQQPDAFNAALMEFLFKRPNHQERS